MSTSTRSAIYMATAWLICLFLCACGALVADGRAAPHHILPDTGWVSYYIRSAADLAGAIALFRLNYDRLTRHIADASAD